MKTTLRAIGSLLTISLLTLSARAAVLVQDNFEAYAQGPLPTNNPAVNSWQGHSGNAATGPIVVVADPTSISANALQVSKIQLQDVHANLDTNKAYADVTVTNIFASGVVGGTNVIYAFSPSNSVNTLYSSFTINVTTVPATSSQTYFAHFYVDSSTFKGRLFLVTNGVAPASGNYRIAIQNAGSAVTNTIPVDLSPNTAYTVVTRYVLSTGGSTVWVNPTSELSGNSATPLDTPSTGNILAYGFRQNVGEGVVDVDNFVVGTRFADVIPGSVNPPSVLIQPADTNVFATSSAVFKTLASGDDTITYQWYYNTNTLVTNNAFSVSGAASNVLVLTNLTVVQSGTYSCVASNAAGTNVTRFALLAVSPSPIPPTIDTNITPTASTNFIGDTVAFTVTAHGLPAPAYQWKFVPATNTLVTNIISGATISTLTLTNISTNSAGSYFVTITNGSGYLTTNSALATLKVNPPPTLTIAQFRSMVDGSFAPTNLTAVYTIQGTVTTWTNMTSSSANCEFYIQDNTGGIAVFWSGAAPSTNLPPAGAIVRVTGPMAVFGGLIEIEPVLANALHSVTIISTNNPLPAAQPLVFDPNVTGYPGITKNAVTAEMEGMYFVASNVMLNLSTPNFVSGANDIITNNTHKIGSVANSAFTVNFTNEQGQQFILFINSGTDIPGKAKSTGPVTIYGVLGYYTTAGYEFTPSRYADIVSYVHVTNILTNARKGDLATNAYTELVVRPGETLKTYVSIGDAAGGTVTLTPAGTLPTGASWSGITSGLTAAAVFQYTGDLADAGMNFPIQLDVSSTTGTAYTESFNIYVPTAQEQAIAITEILANPTTNTSAANFNPLQRSSDTTGIAANDQYVEIANVATTELGVGWTLDNGKPATPIFDSNAGTGTSIQSSNSLVIYGGNGSSAPGIATPVAVAPSGLALPTTAGGLLVLRNSSGSIIDRVVYSPSALNTNGSLARFPTLNSAFVPQPYVSTNAVTPGLQYDGAPWTVLPQIPTGVGDIQTAQNGGNVVFKFTATASQAATLWSAPVVGGPFNVTYGRAFSDASGAFTNGTSAAQQFYYITTQTNRH